MRIPPFWAKAEHRWPRGGRLRVWRSSDRNVEEARAAATARLDAMLAEISSGGRPRRQDYFDRPMREEILSTLPGEGGPAAIVTRNAQGAEVLNAARVMILDLDFAHFRHVRRPGFLSSIFGKKVPPETAAREALDAWAAAEGGIRLRVYRTRAGLRAIRLDRLFDPAGEESQAAMKAAKADPLYASLCVVQRSYRARLTPKYYRIGMKRIPGEWPCEDPELAAAREAWLMDYEVRSRARGVCRLEGEIGAGAVHPEARQVLDLHDRAALRDEAPDLA
jgi:hypothetical protein